MSRRTLPLLALAVLAAGLIALPPALAKRPPAPPGLAERCGDTPRPVFCAGAATADITPPVTSPQFAYTFRHCAAAVPAETAGHIVGAHEHVEELAFWVAGGGPGCVGDKANAEWYSKTFPPSEGTYGRLVANAFVLDDGPTRVAIVQADLGGIPGELHTRVAQLTAAAGVDEDHLMISATHTHGSVGGIFASGGYAALGGDLFDERVFEAVAQGIARAVTEAAGRLQPAKLAVGFGEIVGANGNRRVDAWNLNPEAEPAHTDDPQATRLMVMRVDSRGGVPLGVITNFTNHGVIHGTFNQFLTGDNQGQATRQVAAAIRARAEAAGVAFPDGWEVVDSLTNGPAGDITPRSDDGGWSWSAYGHVVEGPPFQQFARMENGGARQVPEAIRLWESLEGALSPHVELDARADRVCLCGQEVGDDLHDPYDRDDGMVPRGAESGFHTDDPHYFGISDQPILGSDDGSRESTTLYPGHHRKRARLFGGPTITPSAARVQLLRVNDLALVTMPGEPTIQMGRRIERSVVDASGGLFARAVLVGLANDYVSYMTTTQEYEAYRYEGGFSLWGQQTGNLFKERLVQLTGLMAAGTPVPPCTVDRGCLADEPAPPPTVAPPRFLPDVGAGTADREPEDVERFQGTRFTWVGGSPGAEWSLDDPLVELQRLDAGGAWTTVASDMDPEVPVRYDKRGPLHTWTAFVDPTVDLPAGTYRLVVTGHAGTLGGDRAPDTVESRPFQVAPSTALGLAANPDGSWSVVHPPPTGDANFRYRTRVSATATIAGVPGPSFQLAPGTVIPAGAITDAWGNTNGTAIVVP